MEGNNGFDNQYRQPDYGNPEQDPVWYGNSLQYSYEDRSVWNSPAPSRGKRLCGRLSYVFGIISLCILCTGSGLPLAIAALVLGYIGKDADYNADKAEKGRRMGIIALVLNVVWFITLLIIYEKIKEQV